MRILGVDLGKWKAYMAILELTEDKEKKYRIIALETPDNQVFEEALEGLFSNVGFDLMVVDEPHPTPLREEVPVKDLEILRKMLKRSRKWCERKGVAFASYLSSRNRAWYEKPPGWRQALTGLLRPSEWDLFYALMGKKRAGVLMGRIPKHPGLVDAIGLAIYGAENFVPEEPSSSEEELNEESLTSQEEGKLNEEHFTFDAPLY